MNTLNIIRNLGAAGIGLAFISVGVDHFIHPSWYEPIVPSILGDPRFWVLVSGVFEILFGLFFIIPQTRAWASVGGAWLLVVLYWANFNMWYNNIPLDGKTYDDIWHVVRLLIQIVLIFSITWIGEVTPFKGREKCMIHLTYSMEESHQVHLNPVIESLLEALEGINLWRIY